MFLVYYRSPTSHQIPCQNALYFSLVSLNYTLFPSRFLFIFSDFTQIWATDISEWEPASVPRRILTVFMLYRISFFPMYGRYDLSLIHISFLLSVLFETPFFYLNPNLRTVQQHRHSHYLTKAYKRPLPLPYLIKAITITKTKPYKSHCITFKSL